MLRPTAVEVIPKEHYLLEIGFDSGKRIIFDVKPYIKVSWYGELADPVYFKTALRSIENAHW